MVVSFEKLSVWKQKKVFNQLKWYHAVSNNQMPAKYLICKRISAKFDKQAPEEELWSLHQNITQEFLGIWQKIRNGQLSLTDLPIPEGLNLLDLNVTLAKRMLQSCVFCEWNCQVDRTGQGKLGTCQLESDSRVSTFFHHPGEELVFRGTQGSGTIFFTSCNMRCSFCQNGDISTDKNNGKLITPELVASMAWQLRVEGCHNVNFVGGDPTIHLHTIIEAIEILGQKMHRPSRSHLLEILPIKNDFFAYNMLPATAQYQGEFNVPMLWNSNFYMTEKTMRLLRTVIDVWLPDFKFSNNKCSIKLSRTPKYIEAVTRNHLLLKEWGEDLVIRHLIMPNHVECCTLPIFEWIHDNMPDALVNVMDQYHPDCFTNPNTESYKPKYEEINRRLTTNEIKKAYQLAKSYNLNFEDITFEKSIRGIQL